MDEFQVRNCLSATCLACLGVALAALLGTTSLALLATIGTHRSGGLGRCHGHRGLKGSLF